MSSPPLNIIGRAGSGKTHLAKRLESDYGFVTYRPSDAIREYADTEEIELNSRGSFVKAHNAMLRAITDAILALHQKEGLVCIDGLRAPKHAETIAKIGLITVELEASNEVRFARALADPARNGRKRPKFVDLAAFLADEKPDEQTGDPSQPSMPLVMARADLTIDTTLEFNPGELYTPEDVLREVGAWLIAVYGIKPVAKS